MTRASGLEKRVKAWAWAGALTLGLSVLACLGLIVGVWRHEVRAVRRDMDAYTRGEALALGRNLLYDLASDPSILRTHLLERTLANLPPEAANDPRNAPPAPELQELIQRNPELPDTQLWQLALQMGLITNLADISAARRAACEAALRDSVEDLQEDMWARVTFSDHLRGVKLVSSGGLVTVEAGEQIPQAPANLASRATYEIGQGRLLVALPLYVQTRKWGNAYLTMDRAVLSRTTFELTQTLNVGAGLLAGLLVLLLSFWGLWSVWLLRRLRREVVGPVVDLSRRMEEWAQATPQDEDLRGEPERLHGAFDRLLHRVAEQKEQLLRAQRLGLMERIGAGLSHELNNALNPARLRLEEMSLDGRAPTVEDVQSLREYLASAQRILRDISSAAKRTQTPPKILTPAQWLFVAKRLVEPTFHQGTTLEWKVEESGPKVFGEEPALIQVAVNLILNGREAAEAEGGSRWVRVSFSERDGAPYLLIEDGGSGISPEVARHLFEPFVTTKAQGTGLGLFVVDTLVRRMGGRVTIRNSERGGTAAEVFMPPPPAEEVPLAHE